MVIQLTNTLKEIGIFITTNQIGSSFVSFPIPGYHYLKSIFRFWFVGSRIGKRSGWLYVQSDEKHPDRVNKSWRFWDDSEKKWLTDSNIYCVHVMHSEVNRAPKVDDNESSRGASESTRTSEKKRSSRSPLEDDLTNHDPKKQESVFEGSQLEETWFSALYTLYSHADEKERSHE